jgi:transposase InsO family protein
MEKLPRQVYTSELRQQAVQMIERDRLSVAEVSRKLSISQKTLANWVKRAKNGQLPTATTEPGGVRRAVTDAEAEVSRLRREVAELRMERDILKKSAAYFASESLRGAPLIRRMRLDYPLAVLCRTLAVSRSGYHAWCVRQPSRRAQARERLKVATRAAHDRTRATYGAVRLQKELASDGFAAIKDLFAGEIVGRAFGDRMTTALVVRALEQAVATRRSVRDLIHHSDRGSQYASHEYRSLLESYAMRVSMSRRGDCYDTRAGRELLGTLKTELVHHRRYETRREAVIEISEYVDLFYNRQRRQARLGYVSPAAFTQQFMRRQAAPELRTWRPLLTTCFTQVLSYI